MLYLFYWKCGRVVEGTGLENRQGATLREFESHHFRKNILMKTIGRIIVLIIIILLGFYFFGSKSEKDSLAEKVSSEKISQIKNNFLGKENFLALKEKFENFSFKNLDKNSGKITEEDYEDNSKILATFSKSLHDASISLIDENIVYDPIYSVIPYPMGDVVENKGVCTDVIIRVYRELGIDLQELVHEDMQANFSKYPNLWDLTAPDSNIDHRRVPNLMVFFERHGKVKPITENAEDYLPGDIVAWDLGGGMTHIGILTGYKSKKSGNYLVFHNIGGGQVLEDILFKYKIIGHYVFEPIIVQETEVN